MSTAGITIILQQDEAGRLSVHHIITGDIAPLVAANACRAIADTIDRERIRAEMTEEVDDDTESERL